MQEETWILLSLDWEDTLEKEMGTHSSTLAWEIPQTEEPGGLQFMGLQKVGRDWVTKLQQQQKKLSVALPRGHAGMHHEGGPLRPESPLPSEADRAGTWSQFLSLQNSEKEISGVSKPASL